MRRTRESAERSRRPEFERDFLSPTGRNGHPEIWTASSSDGSNAQRVSPPGVNATEHPDWSPDGKWINP